MTKIVNIPQAKVQLSRLIAEAEAGEEVVIARAGRPVAKLISVAQKNRRNRVAGFLKGKIWIGPDFDDPLPEDILKAFRGECD